MKIDTKIILGAISIVDIWIGKSEGILTLALWVAYGIYKLDRD